MRFRVQFYLMSGTAMSSLMITWIMRAPIELDNARPFVVDCSSVSEFVCTRASLEIETLGARKILLLNKGAVGASCQRGPA